MACASEQHRLAFERHVRLAAPEHLGADVFRLRLQLVHGDDARPRALTAHRQQVLAVLPRRLGHDRVGDIEHLLGRAVVLRQRDHFGGGLEALRKAENVFHGGGTEGVDRLGVVADRRQSRAVGLQRVQDVRLQPVGVLVLVDQHVIEVGADVLRQAWLGHHRVPVQQQVIIVEQARVLLLLHVSPIQPRELLLPLRAPRVVLLQRLVERCVGVDAVGVDLQAGLLAREALLLGCQPQLLAQTVHEVRGIGAIDDAEVRIELQVRRVVPQQTVADGMKGTRPAEALGDAVADSAQGFVERLARDFLRAAAHFSGRAARESQHQDTGRIHAVDHEVRHAMCQSVGLAGARAGDDQ